MYFMYQTVNANFTVGHVAYVCNYFMQCHVSSYLQHNVIWAY